MKRRLPWKHNKEDMNHFKELTKDNIIVMGRKTWESLPFKLPNRIHVVLSTKEVENSDYTILLTNESLYSVIDRLRNIEVKERKNSIVIGGKQTYEFFLPAVKTIYHTIIKGEYECDVSIDLNMLTYDFSLLSYTYSEDETATFFTYKRKNPPISM